MISSQHYYAGDFSLDVFLEFRNSHLKRNRKILSVSLGKKEMKFIEEMVEREVFTMGLFKDTNYSSNYFFGTLIKEVDAPSFLGFNCIEK